MITEQNLINLGFQRNDETAESSGSEKDWHYYTLDIGEVCLITSANDEIQDNTCWHVHLFEYTSIDIDNMTDLVNFIDILKKITVKNS
jgi:hypothetical protein